MDKCKDCKWWLKGDKEGQGKAKDLYDCASSASEPFVAGFCIRFPPSCKSTATSMRAGWVVTRPDDYCGEFLLK